ncbi:MAG: RNase adapter RapZ [Gammaproteobacteria bacterium]|nr:RNase adapter RapZ [Gammaproteobacteria bacterium]
MKLIIISGRSGSGKSTALHVLEDNGFNCIDNLPVGLLPALFASAGQDGANRAVSIDARNLPGDLERFPEILEDLQEAAGPNLAVEIIFLDADTTTLVRRFSETRRRHPLSRNNLTLPESLQAESVLLEGIANLADLTIDSSRLSHHDLRELVRTRVVAHSTKGTSLLFISFAFSAGVPVDADLVFDVRCLPNPHWIPELRAYSGRDEAVQNWFESSPEVERMFSDIHGFLDHWLPAYARSNRSYMSVAIGCTGGRHRSVYLAERLKARFADLAHDVLVRHRDLS